MSESDCSYPLLMTHYSSPPFATLHSMPLMDLLRRRRSIKKFSERPVTHAELGLGTAIRTGGVMGDDAARAAAGVAENERIVAVVNVGEPAELPGGPKKRAAAELTTWVS